MRYILCLILTSILGLYCALGKTSTPKDSLLDIINNSTDLSQPIAAYRNLADLYFEEPEENHYLNKMYLAAKRAGDKNNMFDALSDLAFSYIKNNETDSAKYCMHILEQNGNPEETMPYLTFIRMRLFEGRLRNNEAEEAIKEELAYLNAETTDKNNIYTQIEQSFATGYALYNKDKYSESGSYLKTAYKLACQLPYKEGERLRTFTMWCYASTLNYLDEGAKFVEYIENALVEYQKYYELYYAGHRPFYNMNVRYLQCYTALLMRIDILPKDKVDFYYNKITRMSTEVTDAIDKYNCFFGMNNYFLFTKDYVNALATNDSLIKYAQIVGPSNIPGLLDISSQIYEEMGDYKNAFIYHKLYVQKRDSLTSSELHGQLNELQVKYEVDRLSYVNSKLENENKRIMLITLASVLLLAVGVCFYLYYNLKRERRMKKALHELNKKAEESEKLKTAFINSMCHEIRTPLNAIVGFSGIITDVTIDDEEAKKEYYDLITQNSQMLTSLIDHLFVVANLDSSEELLPCETVNIKNICKLEMNKAEQQAKPGITYQLELPAEDIFISTNEQYLSLVIENLLNNANKFTEKGHITLRMWLDKAQSRLRIDITDTGCGIPVEKQELVFHRFSKLDEFVQGNGLGLYLSRLIVSRLSGTIFVDSSYTGGTRLVIYLPV